MSFLKLSIYIAVFLSYFGSALDKQEFKFQTAAGIWTEQISPYIQQDKAGLPAQYFMCGFQLKMKQFQFSQRRCKRTWYGRKKCWTNWYYPIWRTNGFNAIFCSYNNWSDQKTLTFTTNDSNNPGWTQKVMCPQGTFTQGFQAGFGIQRSTDMGFNGLRLNCQSLSQHLSTFVSKSMTQQYQGKIVSGKIGFFVSSLELKYIENGMLTGIKCILQAAPQIVKVDFIYNLNSLNFTPKSISNYVFLNGGTSIIQKTSTNSQQVTTQRSFLVTDTYKSGYKISTEVDVEFPLIDVGSSTKFQYFQQKTNSFQFGKKILSKWSSTQSVKFLVPGKTKVVVDFLMYSQNIDLPFTAQVSFANRNTKQLIGKAQFEGRMTGILVQKFLMKITQQAYTSNLSTNN